MLMARGRKIEKKQKRFLKRLAVEKGVISSETPTSILILCNVGQATGLTKTLLEASLKKHLPGVNKPKFWLLRGESYCFLGFENKEDATLAYDTLNGKVKLTSNEPFVYMHFAENVPKMTTECLDQPPNGLKIIENFINEEEEEILTKLFDVENSNNLKNRKVWHYGFEFRYGTNDVDLNKPLETKIPSGCDFIWERLKQFGKTFETIPDQLTVNKYFPGQGIASHVDTHSPFGSSLVVVSLKGDVVMDWKHRDGRHIPVFIPKRSFYIMEGEARYDWQHGIQARSWDPHIELKSCEKDREIRIIHDVEKEREARISLTFRWTRSGKCECDYPFLCDSRSKKNQLSDDEVAIQLEELHVHNVYDKIASHFSTTRHKPWPQVLEFVHKLPPASILLDLGSGNGKNICSRSDIVQIAVERSGGLLEDCRSHINKLNNCSDCLRGDMLNVPMLDGCADSIICIAVIHHFSSRERRLQSLISLSRLLRKNGTALITVWARDQTKANYLAKDNESKHAQSFETLGITLPVHENRTQFKHNDLLVPWKLRNLEQETKKLVDAKSTLLRYYHVFDEGELENLCKEVTDLEVKEHYYEQGNWCVVVEKI